MSFELLAQAYGPDVLTLGLDEHALGVYRVLCNAHNAKTGRCDPSTATIAAQLAVSTKTVERALHALRTAKLIETTRKHDRRGYLGGLTFTLLTVPQSVRPNRLTVGSGADSQSGPVPTDSRCNENQEGGNPEGEPVGARADASTADSLISEWQGSYKTTLVPSVTAKVKRHVETMLAEGVDSEHIATGLALWKLKNLHVSLLPDIVQEAINAAERGVLLQTRSGRLTPSERAVQTMAAGRAHMNRAQQRQAEHLALVERLAQADAAEEASRAQPVALEASAPDPFAPAWEASADTFGVQLKGVDDA